MKIYKNLLITIFIASVLSFNTAEAFGGFGSFVKDTVGGAVDAVTDFGTDTLISPVLSGTNIAIDGIESIVNNIRRSADFAQSSLDNYVSNFFNPLGQFGGQAQIVADYLSSSDGFDFGITDSLNTPDLNVSLGSLPTGYVISPLLGQAQILYDSLRDELGSQGSNSSVGASGNTSGSNYDIAGDYTGSGGPVTDRGCGRYEGEGGFLWKPISESNGNLVVLLPSSMTGLTNRGTSKIIRGNQTLETGSFTGDEHNGGREHYRFGKAGFEYGRSVIFQIDLKTGGSESWFIPNEFTANGDKGCMHVTSQEFFAGLGQNVENNQEEVDAEFEDVQDPIADLNLNDIYDGSFDSILENLNLLNQDSSYGVDCEINGAILADRYQTAEECVAAGGTVPDNEINTRLNNAQDQLDRDRTNSVSRDSEELNNIISDVLYQFEIQGYFEEGSPSYIDEDSLRNTLFDYYDQILEVQVLDPVTQLPPGLEDKMDIKINPVNPRPGENVSVEIQSYSFDSTNSYFVWIKNGEIIEQGVGVSSASFKLDNSGLPESLEIIIEKKNGGKINRFVEIKPSEIDIIYEPNTYTHPFYDGKPVFTHESNVRFIAIPSVLGDDGEKENISNFNYKWLVDGKPDNSQSGVGENTFLYQSSFISEPVRVSVQISSLVSDFYTQKTVEVSPENPITLIYEDNPLNGIVYEKAITGSIPLSKKEVRLKAVPLFFSKDGNISFEWLMNNNFINENFGDTIILRSEDDQSGTANIIINAENLNTRLQNDRNSFNIIFNNE
jgi:hypothetical protein